MKVKVYWNLHKKCFSVQDYKTRRVIDHVDSISLINPEFRVSEKGRQRVLKEKRKNVHAFVVGYISEAKLRKEALQPAYYNPYKTETFISPEGSPVLKATVALLDEGKVYYNG